MDARSFTIFVFLMKVQLPKAQKLVLTIRGLHGSDIHMVRDKCWIWIGFYRIDGYGYGYGYSELDLHNL